MQMERRETGEHERATDEGATDDGAVFAAYRGVLFGIAYRMIGSVSDAEDIVQEAFLRWQQRPTAAVRSPKAFLSTVVTHLSIDYLRAARVRREAYIGPWLPEPLLTEREPEVAETAMLHESLSMAFLVLLEMLTPEERAAFLLHDVFGYDFREVAGIIGKGEANCRQLARRARLHALARRPRFAPPPPAAQERLTRAFVQAYTAGDMPALLALLADDIVLQTDGGGVVKAALNPIHGPQHVARLLLGLLTKAPPDTTFRAASVNGTAAVITDVAGQVFSVVTFEWSGERICALRVVTNPEKLRGIAPATPAHILAKLGKEQSDGTDTTAWGA